MFNPQVISVTLICNVFSRTGHMVPPERIKGYNPTNYVDDGHGNQSITLYKKDRGTASHLPSLPIVTCSCKEGLLGCIWS